MKILMITPTYFPKITGNAVSAKRIILGLEKLSHKVLVRTTDKIDIEEIKRFNPDIIHALHAYRSRIAMPLSCELKIPFIITLTGSDYEECIDGSVQKDCTLKDDEKIRITLEVMDKSCALVVYNEMIRENILLKIKRLDNKIEVIKKNAPIITPDGYDFRSENNIGKNDFVFTLISGIRPRKNNLFPIDALTVLREKHDNIVLALVGPVSDEDYDAILKESIKDKTWVKYVGEIPTHKMGGVYSQSDVILNCSHYEGESNAVVEAMFFGKPLLISEVPGNTPLIAEGVNGFMYKNEDSLDFAKKAERLYNDRNLLKKIGNNARLGVDKFINLNEAKDYESLYSGCIKKIKKNEF